jgi:hypothetical protein
MPQRAMLLLTYTVGEHVDLDEYHQWLRDVDNPFFNSVPGIKRYANWKIEDEKIGSVAFTHYDLMEIDDLEAWERVWSNERLQAFAQGWTERWSVHGTDPQYLGMNFQVVLATEIAAPDAVYDAA